MKEIYALLLAGGVVAMATEGSGELNLSRSFFVTDSIRPVDYGYQEFYLKLGQATPRLRFHTSIKTRLWDRQLAGSLSDLVSCEPTTPYELLLWEAYAEVYGFGFEPIDLKIGRQRIAWGTADRLNPTDNLNPLDLSDPFNFGERLPSDALSFSYNLTERYTLTGIYLFSFKPALLPRGSFPLFSRGDSIPVPPGTQITQARDSLSFPSERPEEQGVAAKLSGEVGGLDLSLSYSRGHDCLPLPDSIQFTPLDAALNIESFTHFGFPRIQVIGADFAGEVFSVGIWGEAAWFLPEKYTLRTVMPNPDPRDTLHPFLTQDSVLLHNPYLKFTIGFDYTFRGGPYINTQWMHGFFTDRGKDLNDYLITRMEKKFFQERLRLCLDTGIELDDFQDLGGSYGYALIPGVSYFPTDNLELSLGGVLLDGKDPTLIGQVKDLDLIYLKTRVSF